MNQKTILIVDDEQAARHQLKQVINSFPQLKIVGEVNNGKSAIEQIIVHQPDIVFLDIEMPELSGFDVAKATQHISYQLVFLTAFEQYALQAFDTKAIDYLVKPSRPELIKKSIDKILRQEQQVKKANTAIYHQEKLVLTEAAQHYIVQYHHINYIEGIGRYRRIHLTEDGAKHHQIETMITDLTLDSLAGQLPQSMFHRLHRSYIVQFQRVLELKLKARRHFVKLAGTSELIPVSRSFVPQLKKFIEN